MDIYHDFWIDAPAAEVFFAISSAEGLDAWWTLTSAADPRVGGVYALGFGPGYDWRGTVTRFSPGESIEWQITRASDDWQGTRVGIELTEAATGTDVRFHHTGWQENSRHYRISCFCWAMYLRLMKKYVEDGSVVPYDRRLEV